MTTPEPDIKKTNGKTKKKKTPAPAKKLARTGWWNKALTAKTDARPKQIPRNSA